MASPTVSRIVPDLDDPQTYAAGIPHDFFAELRATPGLYWQAADHPGYPTGGFWVVTRRDEIVAIELDSATLPRRRVTCLGS
jgi:hypothetical protein